MSCWVIKYMLTILSLYSIIDVSEERKYSGRARAIVQQTVSAFALYTDDIGILSGPSRPSNSDP